MGANQLFEVTALFTVRLVQSGESREALPAQLVGGAVVYKDWGHIAKWIPLAVDPAQATQSSHHVFILLES